MSINTCSAQICLKIVQQGGVVRELTATDSMEMSDRQTVYTFVCLDTGRLFSRHTLTHSLQTNTKSQLSSFLNQKLQGVLGVG